MAERSDLIIGIDLGTTNSEVAYVQDGEPIMVPNPEGQHKTPSVVGFFENGEIVVGEIARRQYSTNPSNTVVGVKRLIGKYYSEMEKSGEINLITTEVVSQDDLVYIKINNLGYTPQQISGLILKHLKESAEQHLDTEVTQAVISVPAYFDDVQREATIEAGNLAGLEVMRLVNEPTAAAMAYGLDKDTEEIIAVYDFGGGTFDISILETEQNAFEVLTTTGDTHLGGIDFDNILLDFLLAAFKRDSGVDLCEDRAARLRLLDAAERAKCELSVVQSTLISLPFITTIDKKPIHFEMRISRDEFEPLIEQQVDRTLRLCKSALRDAKLKASDIDRVILVGGSSRIPLVQDAVEDFFGTPPYKGINPDEIVALGAATQAGVLSGALQEVVLLDVTPHTLGIETINNSFSPLIEKNSTLPITSDKTFTTTEDDQEYVVVHVLQGDSEKASENKTLGKFTLTGIEKSQAGNPRIKVDFRINTDGVVEISASDLGSGIKQALVVSHHIGNEPSVPRKKRSRTSTTKPGTRRTKLPAVLSLEGIELTRLVPDIDLTQKASPEEMKGAIAAMVSDQATTPKPKSLKQPTKSLRRDKEPAAVSATKPALPSRIAYTPPDSSKYTLSSSLVELEECLFGGGSLEESYESAPNKLIGEYNALIKKYPDRIDNHIALALVYLELGMQEESCAQVKMLHQKSSNVTDSLIVLSNKLVDRFPNYLPARVDRAHFFSISDDIDQAIGDFEYLVGKDQANEELMNLLAELYIKKLEQNKDSAIQMKLVKLYIRKDDLDQAISLLQILEQDEKSHDHASKILGLCFWEKGLFYLAWQKIKSLPVNEELKDILYRLSKDLDSNGQLNAAEYALEKIYSVDIEYKDVKDRIKNLRDRIEYRDDTSAHPKESVALDDPRFEVLEEINRGNMGIVYKARDKALDDIVAVKVLIGLLANDESSVRRFKREARAAKKLSHPNIVRIHDFYETPNKKFLSMEFISGKDLKKILQEEQYLPETVLINYCIQIIKALRYAHSMGIIHRDIKPANIMITKDNVVKITDFGIAKVKFAQDPSQTGTQIIGTPLYMSPEQIQGKEVDGRTDIYSLGIMMYEMLNGTPPFYDGNIEYQHIHTPPSSLAGATASQELKDIIGKCIEKKIDNRFASADKLLKALRQIKNEETL